MLYPFSTVCLASGESRLMYCSVCGCMVLNNLRERHDKVCAATLRLHNDLIHGLTNAISTTDDGGGIEG